MYLRLFGALIILLLWATVGMANPIHINVASGIETEASNEVAIKYLARLINERSGGRLQVTIIENQRLQSTAPVSTFRSSDIQLMLIGVRNLDQYLPLAKLYELPFLFQNRTQLRQFLDSDLAQKVMEVAPENDLQTLVVWDGASRQVLSNRRLNIPDVLAGRFFSDRLFTGFRGEAEWQDCLLTELLQQSKEQGLDTATLTDHGYSCCVLLTTHTFWERLPEDLRVIINGSVTDATRYQRELTEQAEKTELARLAKEGQLNRIPLTVRDRQLWIEATRQRYPEIVTYEESVLIEQISRKAQKKG